MCGSVKTFLSEFATPFLEGDAQAIASRYDTPIVLVHPFGTTAYDDPADFAGEIHAMRTAYLSCGLVGIHLSVEEVRQHMQGMVEADATWTFLDQNGKSMAELCFTVMLRPIENSFRIAVQIAHNEAFQRPLGIPQRA